MLHIANNGDDVEHNDILPLAHVSNKYHQFVRRATEVEEVIQTRQNCKFCTHPARQGAEEQWERGGNFSAVYRFFEEYHAKNPDSPEMSLDNVKRHIERHYKQQLKKMRMQEYGEYLKNVMQERVDQIDTIEALSSSLQVKYLDVASDTELESLRQVDGMVKLAKIIVDILRFKAELSGDLKQINIFAEKVMNVFTRTIENEQDDSVKRKYLELINSLEDEVGLT